ncbi:MAG: PEP-CTERM sorting domain-containing protein [Verrucomicrobiota bacterium]|nr:PEP-CTERM sorting domain-containing protein [Verrucomicrobiota bacterium]
MSFRPLFYWLLCSAFAVMAVGATKPGLVEPDVFRFSAHAASVQPVPEPSRALLLFAGIMAMAFTYRKAWLSWKRGS